MCNISYPPISAEVNSSEALLFETTLTSEWINAIMLPMARVTHTRNYMTWRFIFKMLTSDCSRGNFR